MGYKADGHGDVGAEDLGSLFVSITSHLLVCDAVENDYQG